MRFYWEVSFGDHRLSVVQNSEVICYIFGSSKCIESTGIAVGPSTVVHYTVDVCYWECLLLEVPLYIADTAAHLAQERKLHDSNFYNFYYDLNIVQRRCAVPYIVS